MSATFEISFVWKKNCQDANLSLPIKNPESAIKKRIPDSDSKICPKIGRIPDCQP